MMGRTSVTVKELAEEFGMDRSNLHRFIKKHQIPTYMSRSMDTSGQAASTLTADDAEKLRTMLHELGFDYRVTQYTNLKGQRIVIESHPDDAEAETPDDGQTADSPDVSTSWAAAERAARALIESFHAYEAADSQYCQRSAQFGEAIEKAQWDGAPSLPIVIDGHVIDYDEDGCYRVRPCHVVPTA